MEWHEGCDARPQGFGARRCVEAHPVALDARLVLAGRRDWRVVVRVDADVVGQAVVS